MPNKYTYSKRAESDVSQIYRDTAKKRGIIVMNTVATLIFYKKRKSDIFIIRILYDGMDAKRHL